MATTNKAIHDNSFWTTHVGAASLYKGSNAEYCRQNGLIYSTFSAHKKKLGLTKSVKRNKPTIRLVQNSAQAVKRTQPAQLKKLPEPEWVARFLLEFLLGRAA